MVVAAPQQLSFSASSGDDAFDASLKDSVHPRHTQGAEMPDVSQQGTAHESAGFAYRVLPRLFDFVAALMLFGVLSALLHDIDSASAFAVIWLPPVLVEAMLPRSPAKLLFGLQVIRLVDLQPAKRWQLAARSVLWSALPLVALWPKTAMPPETATSMSWLLLLPVLPIIDCAFVLRGSRQRLLDRCLGLAVVHKQSTAAEPESPQVMQARHDMPGDDHVTLTSFDQIFPAEALRGLLEAEGIPASLKDMQTVQYNALWSNALGGIKVQVPAGELARAREIMAAFERGDYDLIDEADEATSAPPDQAAAKL
ncbi:putative signal transducing protein [Andreprevotia lacus]|nr:DUF2007 domain-containing protein [Andreprevotia lacus]